MVGIKYCGGCNPKFDRVAFVEELIKSCPKLMIENVKKEKYYNVLYIICGCKSRCVKVDEFCYNEKIYVDNETEIISLKVKLNQRER